MPSIHELISGANFGPIHTCTCTAAGTAVIDFLNFFVVQEPHKAGLPDALCGGCEVIQ